MATYQFEVTDMTCEGCEKIISQALLQRDDVTEVTADHISGEVEVEAEEGLEETLTRIISEISYNVECKRSP